MQQAPQSSTRAFTVYFDEGLAELSPPILDSPSPSSGLNRARDNSGQKSRLDSEVEAYCTIGIQRGAKDSQTESSGPPRMNTASP